MKKLIFSILFLSLFLNLYSQSDSEQITSIVDPNEAWVNICFDDNIKTIKVSDLLAGAGGSGGVQTWIKNNDDKVTSISTSGNSPLFVEAGGTGPVIGKDGGATTKYENLGVYHTVSGQTHGFRPDRYSMPVSNSTITVAAAGSIFYDTDVDGVARLKHWDGSQIHYLSHVEDVTKSVIRVGLSEGSTAMTQATNGGNGVETTDLSLTTKFNQGSSITYSAGVFTVSKDMIVRVESDFDLVNTATGTGIVTISNFYNINSSFDTWFGNQAEINISEFRVKQNTGGEVISLEAGDTITLKLNGDSFPNGSNHSYNVESWNITITEL